MVLAPPSYDPETGETWRWLCPPWDQAPQYPSQALQKFLQQHFTGALRARPAVNLSWQEIYCLASPHEPLLQALAASSPQMEDYYRGVLQAAVAAGFRDPEVLFPLLWHAPQGDAPQHPERWAYLQKLVLDAQDRSETTASRENIPFKLLLDNPLLYAQEHAAGKGGEFSKPAGLPGSLSRRSCGSPRDGAETRYPLSSRKNGGYFKEE